MSTAERLLRAIEAGASASFRELALMTRVSERRLKECRDGIRPLDLDAQMRLAAAVMELAPQHKRLAYRLYGQAQSALRTSDNNEALHQVYPRSHLR
jgi:hypothetical protein